LLINIRKASMIEHLPSKCPRVMNVNLIEN
jgi:phage FluMu protein Com